MTNKLTGLSFTELTALRESLHQMLNCAFDELCKGERKTGSVERIDADPFHDGLPYREVELTLECRRKEARKKERASGGYGRGWLDA